MSFRKMTRKPKNSNHSPQFSSSNHHYRNGTDIESTSQSPYESYEEEDNDDRISESFATNPPINDQLSNASFANYNSYTNIVQLPIFHGNPNECPFSHISRFIKVCRANNGSSPDMMLRIFPVTLENEAALWYDLNIEPYPSLSWEEIKISFIDAYSRIDLVDQLRSDLMNLKQGNEECVRSYFLRLQWILKRWPNHGLNETILKEIFMKGLIKDFRDWVILKKPNSLNEALSLSFSFERMKNVRDLQQKIVKCGFCEGFHEEKCCEIKERMRGLFSKRNEKKKKSESDEEEKGFSWNNKEKSQCLCSKHQCWRKKLDRNSSSFVSRYSNAD